MNSGKVIACAILAVFLVLIFAGLQGGYISSKIASPGMNVNMTHHYVLETDYNYLDYFVMEAGLTNVKIFIVPVGFWVQDRHFHRLGFFVDTSPGEGEFVRCTLTDGTDSLTVELRDGENSGVAITDVFDFDVSIEKLTLSYTQSVGGVATKGYVTILYHYKINE